MVWYNPAHMETTPAGASGASKTSARDFFLWAGAMLAFYLGVTAFITLLFEYINSAFPDPLAGWGDPYSGAVRFAMAALIVLVPTTLVLMRIIRGIMAKEPGKANIWVRRWALVLTIFVATVSILIDLITLINTFLGGEITMRFGLKVAVVLLVAAAIFFHFIADLKGYWIKYPKRANTIGIAVAILSVVAIVSGFFIIGTPAEIRGLRYDQQKVGDLQNIQYQIVNYWQQKQELPANLEALNDPLASNPLPKDPQGGSYSYEATGPTSFKLCATFNAETPDTAGKGEFASRDAYYYGGPGMDENWQHGPGETCFTRTIDPERYPPFEKPLR